MLKIIKGLRPTCVTDITRYTDAQHHKYVRVMTEDEDFCVTTYDYVKNENKAFTWDEALQMLKADGLTTFTKKQAELCAPYLPEINDILDNNWYWTLDEYDDDDAWYYDCFRYYDCFNNQLGHAIKRMSCGIRTIVNL